MIFGVVTWFSIGLFALNCNSCTADFPCPDGRICPDNWLCCNQGCCVAARPTEELPRKEVTDTVDRLHESWYFEPTWMVIGVSVCFFLMLCMYCILIHGDIPNISFYQCSCCVSQSSEQDSAGSVYPPPRYSRCGSFRQAPPPYSEVTSKPDLYPLVITCGEPDAKAGGNYLMVHYFRNYVIRAPGSLSATSTAESLNSSFICNAANEANSVIPPPYSRASNYDGVGVGLLRSLSSLTDRDRDATFRENLMTSPVTALGHTFDIDLELIDCDLYYDGGRKPRLGSSPPVHRSPSDVEDQQYDRESYDLRHLFACPSPEAGGACESPPQPTSPTQTSRDSTLRRCSDERRQRRTDSVKKTPKARKASLYMPLSAAHPSRSSRISPGTRVSSRSAPTTPCGVLVPNLLQFTQRMSASKHSSRSSRLEEESDPLLTDNENENTHTDHKF